MEFRCAFERIFERILSKIWIDFLDSLWGHNLLMVIDNLLMLKNF